MTRRSFLSMLAVPALAAVVPKKSCFFLNGLFRPDHGLLGPSDHYEIVWPYAGSPLNLLLNVEEARAMNNQALADQLQAELDQWMAGQKKFADGAGPALQAQWFAPLQPVADQRLRSFRYPFEGSFPWRPK